MLLDRLVTGCMWARGFPRGPCGLLSPKRSHRLLDAAPGTNRVRRVIPSVHFFRLPLFPGLIPGSRLLSGMPGVAECEVGLRQSRRSSSPLFLVPVSGRPASPGAMGWLPAPVFATGAHLLGRSPMMAVSKLAHPSSLGVGGPLFQLCRCSAAPAISTKSRPGLLLAPLHGVQTLQ